MRDSKPNRTATQAREKLDAPGTPSKGVPTTIKSKSHLFIAGCTQCSDLERNYMSVVIGKSAYPATVQCIDFDIQC